MAIATNDMPKRKRVRYSAEYRAEALTLAERLYLDVFDTQAVVSSGGHYCWAESYTPPHLQPFKLNDGRTA